MSKNVSGPGFIARAALIALGCLAWSHAAYGQTAFNWTVAREGHPNLNGVASNGSVYVMVADYGEIYTSTNGVSWNKQVADTARRRVLGVTWAAGQFVAVGDNVVLTSADGTSWTTRTPIPSAGWLRLRSVAHGNGRYVAVGDGGTVLWSPDAVSWTAGSSGTTHNLRGVAFGSGAFVAVGRNRTVLTSNDGSSWSPATVPSDDPDAGIEGVTYTGSRFVAVGRDWTTFRALVMTSLDSEDWTRQEDVSFRGTAVISGNGRVIVLDGGVHISVDDGLTWTSVPLPSGGLGAPHGLSAGAYGPAGFVACGGGGALYTAPDSGSPWTARTLEASRSFSTVAEGNGVLCAGGAGLARSTDGGVTWTNLPLPDLNTEGVAKLAFGNGVFVGAACTNTIQSPTCSEDWQGGQGVYETLGPDVDGFCFTDVAFGVGQFVAGGIEGSDTTWVFRPILYASTDGVNWARQDLGSTEPDPSFPAAQITSVAYGNGRWVATWPRRALITSEDGATWTQRAWPFGDNDASVQFVHDRFIAGSWSLGWTSADGLTWTPITWPGTHWPLPGTLAYGAGRYVASGSNGTLHVSTDLVQWTANPTGTGHNLNAAAYLASLNRFVAVGDSAIVYSSASPTVAVSDASVTEGNAGKTDMVFTVTLFDGSGPSVSVDYTTTDVSATAGLDYTAVSGRLKFDGTPLSSQSVIVKILGDAVPEPDETFRLNLSNPAGASIGRGSGVGTIVNDDGGRISGVVRHDGAPLAGVEVGFFDASGTPVGTSQTDSSGTYTSRVLTPGGNYAQVNWSPYVCEFYDDVPCGSGPIAAGATPIPVAYSATTPGIDFDLEHTGTIAGHVSEEGTGAPLAVTVWIRDEGGNGVDRFNTDDDGNYSRSLPPGVYRIVAGMNAPDHVAEIYDDIPFTNWPWGLTGTPVTITENATTSVIIQLARAGSISGTVTDATSGAPVPGQQVCIWHSWALVCGTTGADGVYSIGGLPAGQWPVLANDTAGYGIRYYDGTGGSGQPSYGNMVPPGATRVEVTAGAATTGIDFALQKGSRIEGTVTAEATGSPLANVAVDVFSEFGQRVMRGQTDTDGRYVVGGLGAGTYYLRTDNSAGYANECFGGALCPMRVTPDARPDFIAGTPVVLAANSTALGVDFTLAMGGRISGRITNAQRQGIGANVTVFDGAHRAVATASTNNNGNYVTGQGLPAGSYYVFASSAQYVAEVYDGVTCLGCDPSAGTAVAVTPDQTTPNIDFVLARGGQIAGRVVDATTGTGFPVVVEVWNASGVRVSPDNQNAGDFAGGYVTNGLPTGTYFVRTNNWSGYVDEAFDDVVCTQACVPTLTTPVAVTEGRVTWGVDFGLVRGARLTGTVTNSAGEPMGGTQGQIHDSTGRLVAGWYASNPQGRYVSDQALPVGTYRARTRNLSTYLDEVYDGQPCIGSCNVGAGTSIVVSGSDVPGIDFVLQPSLAVSDATISENGGSASFSVTLSHALTQPVTVPYETTNGTATAGIDYTTTAGTLTFAPGEVSRTILVPITNDTQPEGDETFLLQLGSANGALVVDGSGTGTITDDDRQLPALSIGDASVAEGKSTGTLGFIVSLSRAFTQTVTVLYATANATATAGSDYQTASGTLTFLPGETQKTVSVVVLGDTVYEKDETLLVNVGSPTNATIGDGNAVGTIVNDDPKPAFAIKGLSRLEGSSGTTTPVSLFTVTLSPASGVAASVSWSTREGTALAGQDYLAASGVLVFSPGETSKTIAVLVNGDIFFESNESLFVDLTQPVDAVVSTASAQGTINNDDPKPKK